MATDPTNVTRWKHKSIGAGTAPQGRCEVQFVRADETSNGKKEQRKRESVPTKKLRDLAPLVLEVPTVGEKLTLEIRGDSKTIVDCANSHAKLKRRKVQSRAARTSGENGWVVVWIYDTVLPIERFISFGNTTRKPSALGKASKVVKNNGWIL